jgi:hypothetical protein
MSKLILFYLVAIFPLGVVSLGAVSRELRVEKGVRKESKQTYDVQQNFLKVFEVRLLEGWVGASTSPSLSAINHQLSLECTLI